MRTKKYIPVGDFEIQFHKDYQRLRRLHIQKGRTRKNIREEDQLLALEYVHRCRRSECSKFLPPGYWLVRFMMVYEQLSGQSIDIQTFDRSLVQEALTIFCREGNARQAASLIVTALFVGMGIDLSHLNRSRAFVRNLSRELPKVL